MLLGKARLYIFHDIGPQTLLMMLLFYTDFTTCLKPAKLAEKYSDILNERIRVCHGNHMTTTLSI